MEIFSIDELLINVLTYSNYDDVISLGKVNKYLSNKICQGNLNFWYRLAQNRLNINKKYFLTNFYFPIEFPKTPAERYAQLECEAGYFNSKAVNYLSEYGLINIGIKYNKPEIIQLGLELGAQADIFIETAYLYDNIEYITYFVSNYTDEDEIVVNQCYLASGPKTLEYTRYFLNTTNVPNKEREIQKLFMGAFNTNNGYFFNLTFKDGEVKYRSTPEYKFDPKYRYQDVGVLKLDTYIIFSDVDIKDIEKNINTSTIASIILSNNIEYSRYVPDEYYKQIPSGLIYSLLRSLAASKDNNFFKAMISKLMQPFNPRNNVIVYDYIYLLSVCKYAKNFRYVLETMMGLTDDKLVKWAKTGTIDIINFDSNFEGLLYELLEMKDYVYSVPLLTKLYGEGNNQHIKKYLEAFTAVSDNRYLNEWVMHIRDITGESREQYDEYGAVSYL